MAIKDSGIPRVEFFITTKLMTDMSNIAAAFEASLEKLQIDYVNL
jgi:diketogulonate reductase-like aldo/keto reductase